MSRITTNPLHEEFERQVHANREQNQGSGSFQASRLAPGERARRNRSVIAARTPPTVAAMLDDSYHALAMQLHQFRRDANVQKWDTQEAGVFTRLVGALVQLQETERKNAAAYALGELTDAELEALASQARKKLSQSDD